MNKKWVVRIAIEKAIAEKKGRKKSIYINVDTYKILQKEISDFPNVKVVQYNHLKVMIDKNLDDMIVKIK